MAKKKISVESSEDEDDTSMPELISQAQADAEIEQYHQEYYRRRYFSQQVESTRTNISNRLPSRMFVDNIGIPVNQLNQRTTWNQPGHTHEV